MTGASPFPQKELSLRLGSYRGELRPLSIFGMLYCLVYTMALVVAIVIVDLPRRSTAFSVPFLAVALLLVFGPAFWADRRLRRLQQKHGLICNHCGKPLIKTSGNWLVRTGKCESCDSPLFVIDTQPKD